MIKKITLLLTCVLLMFTQNKLAFAEVNALATDNTWIGLFDELYKGPIDNMIDNNVNTGISTSKLERTYTFEDPANIESVRYRMYGSRVNSNNNGYCTLNVSFKDEQGGSIGTGASVSDSLRFTSTSPATNTEQLKSVSVNNVKYVVVLINCENGTLGAQEIEIFGKKITYEGVSDVNVSNITSKTADLSYKNPVDEDLVKNEITLNSEVVYNGNKIEQYTFEDLKPMTEYTVKISTIYKNGTKRTVSNSFKTKEKEPEKPEDVTNVKWSIEDSRLTMTYTKDPNADYVNIYRDGKLVSEKNTSGEFIDKDLQSDSKYVYLITSHNKVGQSPGVTIEVKTPSKEVSNLAATATEKEVSLTWKMPSYNSLDFARVYRKKVEKGMFARMFKGDTYEALFETNGTTFKDLTVKADTQYEYKVTTVDTKGNETDGKTISIKTKQNNVSGGNTEKDQNGDYVITWKSPTTGQIKVLVGGKEYAIVPASDQKIVIPKDKMVFDLIGMPDVKLVPIDENGVEGTPTKPGGNGGGIGEIVGGGEIGKIINAENVLKGGVQLLAVVGAFVLLGLAFRVVPKLVKMIRDAFSNKKDERLYSGRRRVEE